MNERIAYRTEIEIGGLVAWDVLRTAIDEFLALHDLPANTPFEYIDFSFEPSGVLVLCYENGMLTIN